MHHKSVVPRRSVFPLLRHLPLRRSRIQQRGKLQIHRLAHANPKMRGLDHRKPGKRRFGLGDAPADVETRHPTHSRKNQFRENSSVACQSP